ncbi:ArsA family ATPase [Antrihabitans sp. YC2-6]|uniref:ArsA family ATPase n=1 Tax=Antrihabitans sp. YC2-6 TaxID=2799498 RepID=UPI001F451F67
MSGSAGAERQARKNARIEFFVGKGGVGKTTLAAATAISHARSGENVLLASIDPAHSVGDAFGIQIAHDPGTTAGVQQVMPGLEVIEIDTLALLEDRYREASGLLSKGGGHDHGAEFTTLDAGELTGLPGVQELLGLAEIADLGSDDQWDIIVVDCGPTADTLRTLAGPDMFLGYLERIWPKHRRIASAIGTDIRRAVLAATVEKIVSEVGTVRDLLADRDRTGVRLITEPERISAAETVRIRSALALLGMRIDAVVVNKVLPPLDPPGDLPSDDIHPAVRWYRNRRGEQLDVVASIEESMLGVTILMAQHTGPEPVGLSSLGALAYAVNADMTDTVADRNGAEQTVSVSLESGTGVDSVYAMRLHLPVVDKSSLRLARAEDDLIVGADGFRRRIRLASVLRRCTVDAAELAGDSLIVRFRPDAKVWPK